MTTFRTGLRLGAALVLSSLALAGAQAAGAPGSATGSYLAGRFAQHQDDWTAAALYTAQALAADPDDLALLRRTFLLKLGEGQIAAALGLANRLLEEDKEPQMAIALIAADHLAAGRQAEAEAMAARMPAEGLGKFVAPLTRAWLAAGRGQTDRALEALEPLAGVAGFGALYNLHAGLILDLGGRNEDAAARYAKVAETEAPLRVVQIVGNFLERTGRPAEARKLYEAFQAGSPDRQLVEPALKALATGTVPVRMVNDARHGMAEALFDLGSALQHEGAAETALLFGRIALHLRADLPLARLMIGDVMESRDHFEDALAEYKQLEGNPVLGWTARMRAVDALARLERNDDAIAALKALSAERPERTDATIRLGDLYRYARKFAESAEAYSAALARIGTPQEQHWPVLYARAMAFEKTNRWPEAEADLKAALNLKPNEATLLNYLGYSWIDRGLNLDKAKAMVERAVELKPRDGYIVDSLGWALYSLGDYEGAVAKLERAVELKPVDPTINDHLGDAYWRVGRRNEARFQWTRALRNADEDTQKEAIQAKLDKGLPDKQAAAAKP
ncbi:tetratricopeptide repeat protein [Azospirillum agricola]|uniref:tetratricopeptide repeat protein n=1 Tax=Azospirillum agricola TaxID=1720247 RepID=UPI000A0EFCD5|nr:tetratricopeptide repeat protein [Azospirillum agricola]SMH33665.1 TPR repeat-containing protein [Azospirillum lipoferum]